MAHRLTDRLPHLLIGVAFAVAALGCQVSHKETVDFSGYREIAELATLECYYHNVAEIQNPGTDYLFGLLNVGYKKAWFEYRSSVKFGVNVSEVKISQPDASGTVTITVPPVQIIGAPDVDISSLSDVYADTGILTPITIEDQTEAFESAQAWMLEAAEQDESLKSQALERAKILLKEYVENVGRQMGREFKVVFA